MVPTSFVQISAERQQACLTLILAHHGLASKARSTARLRDHRESFHLSLFTYHLYLHPTARKMGTMPFDLQPTLDGQLLKLRPLRKEDWETLFAVAADPLMWEQHPNRDRYTEAVFQRFFRDALESGGALIAIDKTDGRVIGSSRYHDYKPAENEVEVGYTFLARSHWGGVYNGEMKQLMLQHAFQFVDKVIFVIGPENFRSQRAVEKIGAIRTTRPDPQGRNHVVYEITAAGFARAKG